MKLLPIPLCVSLFLLFSCQRNALPVATGPVSALHATTSFSIEDTVAQLVSEKPIPTPIPKRNDRFYLEAFNELEQMLMNKTKMSFKRAVFVTENAYYNNTLVYRDYDDMIATLSKFAFQVSKQRKLNYNFTDSIRIQKFASVYTVMNDTLPISVSGNQIAYHLPFHYDFDDFTGNRDWSKMFVTKLLSTHTGNCHSLPYLYKIIVEQMGETAYLALAPNHIYIKHWSKKDGWYNTELTSGTFPIDAWLMASGYIHLSAVQNGIYLDTLSLKQSISLCVLDLAQGYKHKFGSDSTAFVLKCCNLALQYFPLSISAMILKAETQKSIMETYMAQNNIGHPRETFANPYAKKLYEEFEALYGKIYQLGYRRMPEAMYRKWVEELNVQKEKYNNKKIAIFK